jgi:hypothetical protein
MEDNQEAEGGAAVGTVAEKILIAVFDEMANDEGLANVASSLRKLVLEEGIFSEAALRAAIFADEE